MLTHSFVVTVYNAPQDVALCLRSLEKSLDFTQIELVLVDDASGAETALILDAFAEKYPQVKLIRHKQNMGYLHSVNDGITACSHDIVTLLNSDAYIPADFVPRVLDCFLSDKNIGVASPVLAHGTPFSVPLTLKFSQQYDSSEVAVLTEKKNEQARSIKPLYPDIVFPDGACLNVRRECFEKIGLFDEKFSPGYFEERDFCMRAVTAGYRTVFIDNLYVYHKSHASFGKINRNVLLQQNRQLFKEKWGKAYLDLASRFPKRKHKKRIFCAFYPFWQYVWIEGILFLSRLFPVSSVRKKIRSAYQ